MGLGGFFKGLGKTALGVGAGFLTGGPAGAVIGGGSALASQLGNKPKTIGTTSRGLDPASQAYLDRIRRQSQQGASLALQGPQQNLGMGGVFGAAANRAAGQNAQYPGQVPGPQPNSWFTGPQQMSIGDQASLFYNPYQQNVIDATKGQFDQLRNEALNATNQQATLGGAYGGSRQAVLAGSRLGQLDLGQANTIANLQHQGYQNALQQGTAYTEQQRQLQQQQMMEPLWRQQQAQQFMNLGMGPVGQTITETQPGGSQLGTAAGLFQTGMGLYNQFKNPSYTSVPNFGMGPAQPWQQPQWGPQYQPQWG
jgi:hypothetical protein